MTSAYAKIVAMFPEKNRLPSFILLHEDSAVGEKRVTNIIVVPLFFCPLLSNFIFYVC